MTDVISNQANCDFLSEVRVVCQSVLSLCKDCGKYNNVMENDNVKQLFIHCVRCANAMLNYQHEQGESSLRIICMNNDYEYLLPL